MLVNRTTGRTWAPTDFAGVDRALFRNNETGGRSSFVRLRGGSRVARHRHTGNEEVVVIAGQVRARLSPLSALHHRVLKLLGLSAGIYERLIAHFIEPALVLSEP